MKFTEFALLPSIQKTLAEKNFTTPTEVQENVIPLFLDRKSVVGIAQTGTGKTLAYALPVLHMLKTLESNFDPVEDNSKPRAVIMVPTRELGEQISKVFKVFTHDTRMRVRPALGGMAMEQSRRNVAGPFEILLATPGRLAQLLEKKAVDLSDVRILIFDEADQMLDEKFLPDSNRIGAACPTNTQMGLFSATISETVQELMKALFSGAKVFKTAGSGKTVDTLTTKNVFILDGKRMPSLEKILNAKINGGTMIFTNTREQCDALADELTKKGYLAGVYRGEMNKNERRTALAKFRSGDTKFLISTDLAGRGLDIEDVERVINYNMPKQMENYLHRVGRTARAGRPGIVFNLVTDRDGNLMERLGVELPVPLQARLRDRERQAKLDAGEEVIDRPVRGKSATSRTAVSRPSGSRPTASSRPKTKPGRPGASRPQSKSRSKY